MNFCNDTGGVSFELINLQQALRQTGLHGSLAMVDGGNYFGGKRDEYQRVVPCNLEHGVAGVTNKSGHYTCETRGSVGNSIALVIFLLIILPFFTLFLCCKGYKQLAAD